MSATNATHGFGTIAAHACIKRQCIIFRPFCFLVLHRAQKIRTTAITKNLFKSNLPKEYYVRKLTDTSAEVDGLKAIIQKLEAQLAATNSKNSNAYKPNQAAGLAALLADKESWRQKLDKVYTDLRVACENYFAMSSKEKLLKVRIKFKETLEQNRKLFNMNGDCLKRVSATTKNTPNHSASIERVILFQQLHFVL